MALLAWLIIGYSALVVGLSLWVDDPWTKIGTVASVIGTAITIVTLALVSYIRRNLLAKNRLPALVQRMRGLNSDLVVRLRTFSDDPNLVKQSLAAIAGLLVAIEDKVPGDYRQMVREAREQIAIARGRQRWFRKPADLTEDAAWKIYESLVGIEEAIKQLVSDLQRT